MHWCRPLTIVVLLSTDPSEAQDRKPARRLRHLAPRDQSDASAARRRADLMRAALEERITAFRIEMADKKRFAEARGAGPHAAEVPEVIAAYQDVIDRFPRTEIAAYCVMRLAGLLQQVGRFDDAAALLAKSYADYAGTTEGPKLAMEAGLVQAQARNDLGEAMNSFALVPKPTNRSNARDDESAILYLSAQEQLLKCELQLRRDEQAKQRFEAFIREFPQFAEEISRFYRFQLDSRDGGGPPQQPKKGPSPRASQLEPTTGASLRAYILAGNIVVLIGFLLVMVFRRIRQKG
jgi:tetratricopeptide (TPR) repeat protein